jgi:hypothetical protein
MAEPRATESFYRRWIFANSWSEGVGLSATLLLGLLAKPYLEAQPNPLTSLLSAVLAVILGTALEGALVGFAQGRVIHRVAPSIPVGRWTVATAVGAGVAWLLGMVPSTIISLLQTDEPATATSFEPAAWLQYGLAVLMGLTLGLVLAFPQMLVLRRISPRPTVWPTANALAWAVGIPLIFIGMDRLPWGGPQPLIVVGVVVICFTMGGVVGAVHGVYLRRILGSTTDAPA